MYIDKEDYEEAACPLSRRPAENRIAHFQHKRIDLPSVIRECDRLFNTNDPEALGKHLRYWRQQAAELGDKSSELSLLSEMMGHYRMTGNEPLAMAAVEDGLKLMELLGEEGSVSAGTILINAATALQAFGHFERALHIYAEAFRCYGENLPPEDWRFAGLLNNMAAAYAATGEFQHAQAYYLKAMQVLRCNNNLMDLAVTYVNLAQLYDQQDSSDKRINEALDEAMKCFNDPLAVRDGYYAHSCSKCASAFGLFGREEDEKTLLERAGDFYARS